MATTTPFLLIPVTLCSFLLVLAAAEQGKAILLIHDKVRCKSDLSRIISNAPVQLVINNATVPGGAGRTTSDGRILMTVSLNSTEQLAALMSNGSSKAYLIAPPGACGVPSLAPGKQMAAAVKPIAMVTINVDDDDDAAAGPVAASADTTPLPVLRATNNGDAVVHLNPLLHDGDGSLVNGGGPVRLLLAQLECLVCTLFTSITIKL